MTTGILFVENYLAGGSDQIARILLQKLPFKKLTIMVNRANDNSILLAGQLPDHVVVQFYNLITIPEMLSLFKCRRKNWLCKILVGIVHLLRYPYFLFSIFYFLSKILKIKAPIFIVNNGGYPGGDFCRSASIAASLVPGMKVFHIVHSVATSPKSLTIPIEWIIDYIIDCRCQIITICRASADSLKNRRWISQDVTVIYNGLEKADTYKFLKKEKNFNIINVGYFDYNKNQALLIVALAELVKKGYKNIHVYFLGNETENFQAKCRLLAKELKVSNQIHFEGFVVDPLKWYQISDLFVLCSFNEGFPLSIIEAMRSGLPVITTGVGGVCELVDDGVSGYIVPCGDETCLANKIEALLLDEEMRSRFGNAGKNLFVKKFTVDRMISEYIRVLSINTH